jgi:hypothetical protein
MAPIIVAAPMMPPVGSDNGAGRSTDSCTATTAYGASDDGTGHRALRKRVCQGHCRQQRQ